LWLNEDLSQPSPLSLLKALRSLSLTMELEQKSDNGMNSAKTTCGSGLCFISALKYNSMLTARHLSFRQLSTQNISLQSIHNLLISLTHRQTDSQSGLHNPLALIPGINYILCLFTVCDATHNNNSSISNDNNNNNSNYDNNKTAKSSSFVTVQLSDELSLAVPL